MGLVRPSGYEVWGGGELHRTMEVDQAVIPEGTCQSGSFSPRFSTDFTYRILSFVLV